MDNEVMTTNNVETTPATQEDTPAKVEDSGTAESAEKLKGKFGQFLDNLLHGSAPDEKPADIPAEKTPKEDSAPAKSLTQEDLQAAVQEERKKWEAEKAEQERLGNLSPEDAAKEAEAKKDAEITTLRTQLLQKELKDDAVGQLSKEGYPVELAGLLDYSSKETMAESMEKVTGVFQNSLAAAIKERLRGKTPEGLGRAANVQNNIRDQIAKNIRGGM